jgi:CDP-diacylglycerol---glycerol-3-phosphate 3-phosphatidyltransferase
MKKKIPYILVWSRAALAMIVLLLALCKFSWAPFFIAWSIPIAVITDIFDGILARKFGISTERLRRLDSQIDLFYWISLLIAMMLCIPQAKNVFWPWIGLSVLAEATLYSVSFIRFGKEPCTHALLSKLWCLFLAIALFDAFMTGKITWMPYALTFGYVAQLDVLMILLVLPSWQKDIPSCYHAYLIRKGIRIKRHRLLNG